LTIQRKISLTDNISLNSAKISILPNQTYRLSTHISAKKGETYAAYILISINDSKKAIDKRIKWISDFTGKPKEYTIIFKAPTNTKNVVIGMRVNAQTFKKGDFEIEFEDIKSLKLEKVENDLRESSDVFEIPTLPNLNEDQYDKLEKKLVWVFGSMRSGSTWLALQLLEHVDNISWNEPLIGNNLNQIRNFANGTHRGTLHYFFSDIHKNQWKKGIRKLILDRAYSQGMTLDKNLVIKEPSGSIGADIIADCLPNSKLIFLSRDGRDIVDSMIDAHVPKSWWKGLEPLLTPEKRLEKIKEYCKSWKIVTDVVKKAYENHNPKLRLLIKYENLLKNTFTELRKIYNFIGISISDKDLQRKIEEHSFSKIPESEKGSGKFARSATPGRWKKNFSDEEQKIMNEMLYDTLKQFDYF